MRKAFYSNWVTVNANLAIKRIREGLWQLMLVGMRDKDKDPKWRCGGRRIDMWVVVIHQRGKRAEDQRKKADLDQLAEPFESELSGWLGGLESTTVPAVLSRSNWPLTRKGRSCVVLTVDERSQKVAHCDFSSTCKSTRLGAHFYCCAIGLVLFWAESPREVW